MCTVVDKKGFVGIAIAEVVSQQGEDSIFWLDFRSQHATVLGKTDESTQLL